MRLDNLPQSDRIEDRRGGRSGGFRGARSGGNRDRHSRRARSRRLGIGYRSARAHSGRRHAVENRSVPTRVDDQTRRSVLEVYFRISRTAAAVADRQWPRAQKQRHNFSKGEAGTGDPGESVSMPKNYFFLLVLGLGNARRREVARESQWWESSPSPRRLRFFRTGSRAQKNDGRKIPAMIRERSEIERQFVTTTVVPKLTRL